MSRAASRSEAESIGLLSIGQVLAKLAVDFPDVRASKIRFLEDQQLVTPQRTGSGYRKYSMAEVDRLRYVLTMQRDHYLPLKVIRQQIDEFEAGRIAELTVPRDPDARPEAVVRLTKTELVTRAGATAGLLRDAVSASLLPSAEPYGSEAVDVLRALVSLESAGIEPRHLRGLKASVDREAGLVEQAARPTARRSGDTASVERATERAHELAALLGRVRSTLHDAAMSRLKL